MNSNYCRGSLQVHAGIALADLSLPRGNLRQPVATKFCWPLNESQLLPLFR